LKVYDVVVVKPTRSVVSPVTVTGVHAGVQVTVYEVMARPPSSDGAVHVTRTDPAARRDTVGAAGVPGTVKGMTVAVGSLTTLPVEYRL
jgi:hypothetical protein